MAMNNMMLAQLMKDLQVRIFDFFYVNEANANDARDSLTLLFIHSFIQ